MLRVLLLQAPDYDTGEACLVPNNDRWANIKYYLGLLAPGFSLLPVRLWLGLLQASVNFCLQVTAEIFWKDAGCGQRSQVGNSEFREKRKNGGESGGRLAKERDADVV